MSMTEIDFIREGMKALQPGLPAPKHTADVEEDMQSTERLSKFVEYIEFFLWILGVIATYFVGGLLYFIWLMNKHL